MAPTAKESANIGATAIKIEPVMAGAEIVHFGGQQLALGFPEEVVKAWMQQGAEPSAWLIPDRRVAHGIVQWALEFPLYHALFVRGLFAKGEKIPVLVHQKDWADLVDYLRLTLLGLTRQELKHVGVSAPIAATLAAETEHLALKRADGQVAQIEDFLQPYFFDANGVAQLGSLQVTAHGNNTYSFIAKEHGVEEHCLAIDDEPQPPYAVPLAPASAPVVPQPFEVVTLGATNGFDPGGPCSCFLVQAGGRSLLVDCGPYVRTLLSHAGVSRNEVSALVLTHAHEDHAVGLSALLGLTRRLRLFVTRETAAIVRRKLAILNPATSNPERLLDDAFDLVYVEPGHGYDFFGLTLRFHYTMHSIPCTGVELSLTDGGVTRRVLVVGDNNSWDNIIQAAESDVLSIERYEALERLYGWQGDLLLCDAGGGAIHGKAEDFADNGSAQVVCVHTGALGAAESHLFTVAKPGHRYTVIAESQRPSSQERSGALRALAAAFGGAGLEWLAALLDAATSVSVNRGQIVVRQGDQACDLFVTLSGELSVCVGHNDGAREVATVQTGEIFGEMAAVKRAPRSATVMAKTPARLLRIPGEVFAAFARAVDLGATLPAMWKKRQELEAVRVLAGTSVTTRNTLAQSSVQRTIEPGSTLIREGSPSNTVYVLVRGRVQVYRGASPLLLHGEPVVVAPGTLIGEAAPFLEQARNASIVAVDECDVLVVRGSDFKRIVEGSPELFCAISRMVRERRAA